MHGSLDRKKAAKEPMSQANSKLARHTDTPGVRSRPRKFTMAVSVIAFFGAIGVVGWFGLSGLEVAEEEKQGGARIIFAGGSPAQVVEGSESQSAAASDVADDEYVVGSFGDPVAELYADDDDGGWSDSALDNAP